MKTKIIFLAAVLTLCFRPFAFSQIFQASSLPNAGDIMVQFVDHQPNPANFVLTAPGAGQTWNYWTSFNVTDTNVYFFVNPSQVPFGFSGFFPNSEFGLYNSFDSTALAFTSNNQGFYIDGTMDHSAAAQFDSVRYINGQLLMPAPMSPGQQRSHNYHFYVNVGYDSTLDANLTYHRTTFLNFIADATGTFNSPAGSFPGCLRMHQTGFSIDSLIVDFVSPFFPDTSVSMGAADTTEKYIWVRNSSPCYVGEFDIDPVTGDITMASFYNNTNVISGLERQVSLSFELFPNPATDMVNANVPAEFNGGTITLINMLGQKILQETATDRITTIPLSGLPDGYYLATLQSPNGRVIHKKFEVSRP